MSIDFPGTNSPTLTTTNTSTSTAATITIISTRSSISTDVVEQSDKVGSMVSIDSPDDNSSTTNTTTNTATINIELQAILLIPLMLQSSLI